MLTSIFAAKNDLHCRQEIPSERPTPNVSESPMQTGWEQRHDVAGARSGGQIGGANGLIVHTYSNLRLLTNAK